MKRQKTIKAATFQNTTQETDWTRNQEVGFLLPFGLFIDQKRSLNVMSALISSHKSTTASNTKLTFSKNMSNCWQRLFKGFLEKFI